MYRIPNTNINSFIEQFNSTIEPLKSTHKVILLGDFNIDLLKDDTPKQNFETCLQSNYFIPTIHEATRIASKIKNGQEIITKTLIDNIFINHNMNFQSGIIETSITDHYTIYIIFPEITKPPNEELIKTYRLHNEHCQNKFNNLLNNSDIRLVLNNQIAESAFPQFMNIFQDSYDKAFPIKTKKITLKSLQKPWITENLITKMKIRDNLNKLAKKKKIDRKTFTDYRNLLTTELRNAKTNYFEEQFETHGKNIKKTWEVINSVIKSKKATTNVLITDEHGTYYEEPKIPSEFIDHITSITDKLTSNIPPALHNADHYLKNRVNQSFRAYQIEPREVNSIIDDLKDNGNKVNCIATSALVGSKHIITPIICHLINLFVQQGYFPDELKLGCITPIYKNGDKEKINNYRPICSLSPLSKIIEKAINNKMVTFLDKYSILSKTQFGFRKNMGTETALLNYIDNLQNALNNKKYSISVFLDLSKAFDVIDHKILEKKLEHYGFRGKFLEFLLNFIKDRKYFVHINGKNSETKTVNIGVPQGSTLGPLLFLIYINDMIHISELFFLTQFADDSTVTYSANTLKQVIEMTETDFKWVFEWLAANKLIINLNKTHLMLFTNRKRPQTISINVNGQTINEVTETKFLGVILDNNLNWNAHIKYISKKISKSVSVLKMLKHTFPCRILKSLYHSLVYPYYTYCNLIWGYAPSTHIESLVLLQKKCIRIISKSGYLDHTAPLFKELKLLKVKQIYNYNCAKFIYCISYTIKHPEFKDRLIRNKDIHDHNTRSKNKLRKPWVRLHQFTHSFLSNGILEWDKLPEDIKSIKPPITFNKKLKSHILESNE